MDREQEEPQFLGFFGILYESARIIRKQRKIFFKITVTFILPLTIIHLAHDPITDLLRSKINRNENTQLDLPSRYGTLSNTQLWENFLIELTYLTFLCVFSLLPTSAVVYAIGSLYFEKTDLTLRKVLSAVPEIWKRLLITFLSNLWLQLMYSILTLILLIFMALIVADFSPASQIWIAAVCFFFYLVGLGGILVVWHLASVVSVLEDKHGIGAMRKSMELLKGKKTTVAAVLLYLSEWLCFRVVAKLFEEEVVVVGRKATMVVVWKAGYGAICFLFQLFWTIAQTMLYLVCKSYHHENIDKSTLADHLGAFVWGYVPLTARYVETQEEDIQNVGFVLPYSYDFSCEEKMIPMY